MQVHTELAGSAKTLYLITADSETVQCMLCSEFKENSIEWKFPWTYLAFIETETRCYSICHVPSCWTSVQLVCAMYSYCSYCRAVTHFFTIFKMDFCKKESIQNVIDILSLWSFFFFFKILWLHFFSKKYVT